MHLILKNLKHIRRQLILLTGFIKSQNVFLSPEQFGIVSQLRRAALSISLNIAEGVGRYNLKERRQFYRVAKASTHECIPLVEVARQQNYIDEETYSLARASCIELAKMISGLIKSLDKIGKKSVVGRADE